MNKAKTAIARARTANGQRRHNGSTGVRGNGANGKTRVRRTDKQSAASQRYADLYEFAPVGYVTFDRTGKIEDVNLVASELLRRKRESLIGAPFSLHVVPEDLSLLLGHLARCRKGERRVETNVRLKRKNGEPVSVLLSSTPTVAYYRDGAQLFQTAIVDLTEHERAEEALRRSEERYRNLFDLVPVAVYACDAEGVIREYNQRAVELWGQEVGRNGESCRFCGSYKIYYPDGRPMPLEKCPMARALRGEKLTANDLEIVIERPSGERRHVISAPRVLRNASGQITGAINCLYDITDRKRTEAALELASRLPLESPAPVIRLKRGRINFVNPAAAKMLKKVGVGVEAPPPIAKLATAKSKGLREIELDGRAYSVVVAPVREGNYTNLYFTDVTERTKAEAAAIRLASVVQSSYDAIVAKDLNGIITDWNESAERIFGYKPKEIVGKSVLTLIPKDRQNEEEEILARIRRGESIDHYETIRRRKDGRLLEVSLTISPVKNAKGKIVGASKIAHDITKQKQAERRLTEQARLLDLSNEAILVRDQNDRITYWNHGAEELYGYTAKEAVGKVTPKLLRTEYSEPVETIYKKLETDNRWSGEIVHRRKDGSKIVLMSHWAVDRDELGQRAFILETNSDITARKQAELALHRSKAMLERLVLQRTRALRVANSELESEIRRRKGLEGQILEISDREQEKLGQELHDGLCQQLTAIGFLARATALRLRDHRVVQVDDLERIAQLINSSVMDGRNIARGLHKEEIAAAEFATALHDLVHRKIWKTTCRLELKTQINIENDTVASQLYRILREAILNANKHARATQIVLKVKRVKDDLVFSVRDNGIGFRSKGKGRGLGFHIMKYRAESIGARLELESFRKGGTRVTCYLPIELTK